MRNSPVHETWNQKPSSMTGEHTHSLLFPEVLIQETWAEMLPRAQISLWPKSWETDIWSQHPARLGSAQWVLRPRDFFPLQLNPSHREANSSLTNMLIISSGIPCVVSTLAHTVVPCRTLHKCPRFTSHFQAALRKAETGPIRQTRKVIWCAANSDNILPEHQCFQVQASKLRSLGTENHVSMNTALSIHWPPRPSNQNQAPVTTLFSLQRERSNDGIKHSLCTAHFYPHRIPWSFSFGQPYKTHTNERYHKFNHHVYIWPCVLSFDNFISKSMSLLLLKIIINNHDNDDDDMVT